MHFLKFFFQTFENHHDRDMAVVTPLNNPGGPEGDTVTVAEKLLNTEY